MQITLPNGPYDPVAIEPKILKFWLSSKFYKPEYDPVSKKVLSGEELKSDKRKSFCIVNPPPNAYARPHLGNVSGYAYQDVLGRFHRMKGEKVLLFPGKDHAAQEAESVYLREVLAPQGKSKEDFEREEFYSEAYKYFTGMMSVAQQDEQRIGLSADFDRDLFTLDPRVHTTIMQTFLKMFNDGLVYKDVRIVNWSPGMGSVVSDIDTDRIEREVDLVYIDYPVVGTDQKISVATTRPETMLGDTAVVVDPTDERYISLIGKYVELPLTSRKIPIIANGRVDKEFGTGAVKLTPSHSPEDYTMMLEWNYRKDFEHMPQIVKDARESVGEIGYVNVIDQTSKMSVSAGEFSGMTTEQARQAIITKLNDLNLISKLERIKQNVTICSRTKTIIEPIMSSQWFVDVDKLKQPAIAALEKGEIKIHPDYMMKKLLFWLENLRDWPISRSIWWGYRFPVWYKGDLTEFTDENGMLRQKIGGLEIKDMHDAIEKKLMVVQLESPGDGWIQDVNVFDTWFSSGQWPFATLMAENLMDEFYPTQVLETAYDILELWVSRMIMLGLYVTGKPPFYDVYLHGIINAEDGQKMSKSKGNSISMDDIANKYGVDTLRLFYLVGNKAGANYRVDYEKIEGNRRFLNKLWNASKFVMMNLNEELNLETFKAPRKAELKLQTNLALLDHIENLKQSTNDLLENFHLGIAAQNIITEFWHTFADIHIEAAKQYLYDKKDKETGQIISSPKDSEKNETRQVLAYVLSSYLKLLHPFIPFITEEIWQHLVAGDKYTASIMHASWE